MRRVESCRYRFTSKAVTNIWQPRCGCRNPKGRRDLFSATAGAAERSTTIYSKYWRITVTSPCAFSSAVMATPPVKAISVYGWKTWRYAHQSWEPSQTKIWAAGQSTGGTMSLIAAATRPCFAGAVSLAPFCSLERILQDNADAKSILEARFGPLQEKHHQAADALRLTRGMTKPALVIHGTQDRTVPMLHGRKLAESIGAAAEFVPIDGGEHHLRNVDRQGLIERIVAWLLAQDRISQ